MGEFLLVPFNRSRVNIGSWRDIPSWYNKVKGDFRGSNWRRVSSKISATEESLGQSKSSHWSHLSQRAPQKTATISWSGYNTLWWKSKTKKTGQKCYFCWAFHTKKDQCLIQAWAVRDSCFGCLLNTFQGVSFQNCEPMKKMAKIWAL